MSHARPWRHAARCILGASAAAALSVSAWAQQTPPPPAKPPLLSTAPTPQPGAKPEPSQMSGWPLQVGDLPPGTVAVRVVRQGFGNNVVNHPVELQVLGAGARVLRVVTDPAGRATFSGLKIGDTVVARTSVDGEPLESQQFALPAEGGVRVALVAGIGAGTASSAASPGPGSVASAPATRAGSNTVAGASSGARWWITSVILGVLGVVALAASVRSYRRGRRERTTAGTPFSRPSLDRREALFQALMDVEDEHAAGRLGTQEYRDRRASMIDELVAIDDADAD